MADSVKSQPKEGGYPTRRAGHLLRRTPFLRAIPLLGAIAVVGWAPPTPGQSILLGPAARRVKAKIELDPKLPTGALRLSRSAVTPVDELVCSPRVPVCVAGQRAHGSKERTPATVSNATLGKGLAQLESAYRRLVYAARLPEPRRRWDPDLGSPAVVWVLDEKDAAPLAVEEQAVLGPTFASASVVCRSGVAHDPWTISDRGTHPNATVTHGQDAPRDPPISADGAVLARDAFLCVGEAIAARLDAAESPRSRRAFAEALWWELGDPDLRDLREIAAANATAYRASIGRDEVKEAASTALFFTQLEHSLGTSTPFGLITGLFALSAQPQPPDTARYVNEPDWLDVLRESLGDDRVDFAHRVNAYAAARAQMGTTAGPLGTLAWTDGLAKMEPDWVLRVSTLPRRVATKHPIQPLGAALIRVDIDVPTQDLALAVRVDWEPPVPFTWTAVKLDATDREIGRLDFAFEPRVVSSEKRIVALEDTKSLLILGTNLGGVDATHLLDPDHSPFEPHGCTIYVVRL